MYIYDIYIHTQQKGVFQFGRIVGADSPICSLERQRTRELLSHEAGYDSSLNVVLKAWRPPAELLVFSYPRSLEMPRAQ